MNAATDTLTRMDAKIGRCPSCDGYTYAGRCRHCEATTLAAPEVAA